MANPSQKLSCLEALPNELLLNVLSKVSEDEDRGIYALYCLSLTNRRLHQLSSVELYRRYSFHYGQPYLFLRTISRYVHLASQVKDLQWDYCTKPSMGFRWERHKHADLGDVVLENHVQAMRCAETPVIQRQGESYEGAEGFLNLFLALTPKLKYLNVHKSYWWDYHYYWFAPILHSPDSLPYLSSVSIQGPLYLENVTALLVLPSMRSLDLTRVIATRPVPGQDFEWDLDTTQSFARLHERGSNVEHFYLRKSFIDLEELYAPMRAFRSLKSFLYEHVSFATSDNFKPLASYSALTRHLSQHLESLSSFSFQNRYSESGTFGTLLQLLRSLQAAPNLRTLDIMPFVLRDDDDGELAELLPTALGSLLLNQVAAKGYSLDSHMEAIDRFMYDIVARVASRTLSSLESVELHGWHPWYGHYPPSVEHIKASFQELGVVFSSRPGEEGDTGATPYLVCYEDMEPGWLFIEKEWCDL